MTKKWMITWVAIFVSWFIGSLAAQVACAESGGDDAKAFRTVALHVGDLKRRFYLYTPPGLAANAPLLIAFHPSFSSGQGMRAMTGATLERMAREHGFQVAYPDGTGGHFDDCRKQAPYRAHTEHIDDVGFTRAIVTKLSDDHLVNASRVYAMGYSNGGQMALRLALEAPDLVAGVISIAAAVPTPENLDCKVTDGQRPNIVLIEGTKDPGNPYKGGNVAMFGLISYGTVMSAPESARWFAHRYDLPAEPSGQPALHYQNLAARIETWGTAQPRVLLISIEGGGHTIPTPDSHFPFLLGRTFADPSVLEVAWAALQPQIQGYR